MPILPFPTPLSSFHIGLRAVIRASEPCIASIAAPTARAFSTSRPLSRTSCIQYSTWGVARQYKSSFHPTSRNLIPQRHVRTIFTFRALTRYIDLPGSYSDAEGLPFRREDLTQRESNSIFPSNIPAPRANLLLKILHGRRVAGTLDDPSLARNTQEFKITDQKRALAYLREHIPVDEVLNAGLRAEDELKAIEEQGSAGEQIEEDDIEAPTGRLPKEPGSDSPYGISTFDRIRAANIAKREAEEARIEEERRLQEEELAKGNVGTLQTQQEKPREISPFRKKYIERATSDLKAPPKISAWQRLYPTLGFTLLVIAGSMAFAVLYQAPPASRRLLPDIPPAAATCLVLMAANLAIWGLWKFPPAWPLFNKYMLVVAATPRPLQIIGAMFSHHTFGHLISNMFTLWLFGTRVHDEIGRGNFLALYFSSGAVAFAVSLANFVLRRDLAGTSLGASGAIYGILTAFFWMHKFDEFKIFGYPPDPISGPQGLGFLALILGIHVMPLITKAGHGIDIASHFGGILAGVLGIEIIRWYMDYKAQARAERLKNIGALNTVIEERDISPPVVDTSSSSPSK